MPANPNLPELLLIEEAAAWLRTPVATLHQWRYLGQGPPAAKVGRRLVYRRTDLDQWVRERTTGAAS